jgi:hypothetical protein
VRGARPLLARRSHGAATCKLHRSDRVEMPVAAFSAYLELAVLGDAAPFNYVE